MLSNPQPGKISRKGRRPLSSGPSLSIVIPTWNGLELLEKHLPSVIDAAEAYRQKLGASYEILLVDDGSTDSTIEHFRQNPIPHLRVISLPLNRGFAATCNQGFREAKYALVGLLNNDVEIDPDYFIHHAEHFRDPLTFAVTARVYDPGSRIFNTGGRFAGFRRGFWSVYFNYDFLPGSHAQEWIDNRKLLSFYAIGGFSTFDREKLLEAGGFLEILSPFHWEDVDLSYRGWKRGWQIKYEPRSLAWHQASSTINTSFKKSKVETLSFKNRLLFHWVNLHSRPMLSLHLLSLGTMCILKVLCLDGRFFQALGKALRQLPDALKARSLERSQAGRSDREVQRLLNDFYKSAPIRVYFGRDAILEHHQDAK